MVDALRRAHRIVTPDGVVVDLHPNATPATIEVGDRLTGQVEVPDGRHRHAAADAAIATVVAEGLFTIERTAEFDFHTWANGIDELREYIEDHWRDAHLDEATVRRTREAIRDAPDARPRSRERVVLTVLRPRPRPEESY